MKCSAFSAEHQVAGATVVSVRCELDARHKGPHAASRKGSRIMWVDRDVPTTSERQARPQSVRT